MSDMSNVTLDKLVSVPEAAQKLQISEVLVNRYIHQGRLRAQKVAGRWFIDGDSLDQFAAEPRRVGNPNFSRKSS